MSIVVTIALGKYTVKFLAFWRTPTTLVQRSDIVLCGGVGTSGAVGAVLDRGGGIGEGGRSVGGVSEGDVQLIHLCALFGVYT